jgi:hypothetical protein
MGKSVLTTLAATAVFAGVIVTAPTPAAAGEEPRKADEYCVVVLGKSENGGMSPVRSHTCSKDPADKSLTKAAAGEVLLMEWFWNANNNPPKLTRIHGDSGPCDSAGYKINVLYGWTNQISGFNTFSNCNVATGYDDYFANGERQTWSNYSGCGCLLQGWVGSYMNDRINSFWIRKG